MNQLDEQSVSKGSIVSMEWFRRPGTQQIPCLAIALTSGYVLIFRNENDQSKFR
jgi:hypothetical protein